MKKLDLESVAGGWLWLPISFALLQTTSFAGPTELQAEYDRFSKFLAEPIPNFVGDEPTPYWDHESRIQALIAVRKYCFAKKLDIKKTFPETWRTQRVIYAGLVADDGGRWGIFYRALTGSRDKLRLRVLWFRVGGKEIKPEVSEVDTDKIDAFAPVEVFQRGKSTFVHASSDAKPLDIGYGLDNSYFNRSQMTWKILHGRFEQVSYRIDELHQRFWRGLPVLPPIKGWE